MAVNLFTGATNSNWGTATNWSLGTVPTATDGHVATFDATSPNCTVNNANAPCNNIDFTAYPNTITMNNTILVYGNITLGTTDVLTSGSGYLSPRNLSGGTFSSGGGKWGGNFKLGQGGSGTLTIGSDFTVNGLLYIENSSTLNGTYNLNCQGSLTVVATLLQGTGTTTINLVGTGTWSGTGAIRNNLTINTAGTLTISGSVGYNTGTLTYTAGTVVTTGSTLTITASTTLNTNGINWNIVTITIGTITNNSLLTCTTSNLASTGAVTFTGTHGFTTSNYSCVTAGRTITLKNSLTYLVNSSLVSTGTSGSRITIASSTTSHAYLTLAVGATQNIQNTNGTWIDSSGGQTIKSSFGTLSNTINWELGQGSWWTMQ